MLNLELHHSLRASDMSQRLPTTGPLRHCREFQRQQCAVSDAFARLARAWSVIRAGCRVRSRPLGDAMRGHVQFNALLPTHGVPLLGDLQCTCYSTWFPVHAWCIAHCMALLCTLTYPPTHLARCATLANTQYTLPCLRTNKLLCTRNLHMPHDSKPRLAGSGIVWSPNRKGKRDDTGVALRKVTTIIMNAGLDRVLIASHNVCWLGTNRCARRRSSPHGAHSTL